MKSSIAFLHINRHKLTQNEFYTKHKYYKVSLWDYSVKNNENKYINTYVVLQPGYRNYCLIIDYTNGNMPSQDLQYEKLSEIKNPKIIEILNSIDQYREKWTFKSIEIISNAIVLDGTFQIPIDQYENYISLLIENSAKGILNKIHP